MKPFLLLFCLFLSARLLSQEQGTIQGRIVDLDLEEPMLFAMVRIKDTDHMTRTNFNGNFEITGVPSGTYLLEVGFLGYETVEIPLDVAENTVTRIDNGLRARSVASLTDKNTVP